MPLTIPLAHDFICPWCWVGLLQAKRLINELGVTIDWKGYELWPAELPRPAPGAPAQPDPNRPPTPSRLDFILIADGVQLPKAVRPVGMLTHNAHEAVEYAKTMGKGFEMTEELYRAYWERGVDISETAALRALAKKVGIDADATISAVEDRRFAANIIGFDEPAYASGVYNVPTFFVDGQRLAEQPFVVIQRAIQAKLHP